MSKTKYTYNLTLVIFLLLAIGLTAFAYSNRQVPKYTYSVRENIEDFADGLAFELWCWREYSGGNIDKEYIGYFTLQGVTNTDLNRINTSLCK